MAKSDRRATHLPSSPPVTKRAKRAKKAKTIRLKSLSEALSNPTFGDLTRIYGYRILSRKEDNNKRLILENIKKNSIIRDVVRKIRDFMDEAGIDPENKFSAILDAFEKNKLLPIKQDKPADDQPLLTKAPALWKKDRRPDDTPATFIMRHYAEHLGKGLTPGRINVLDPTLGARLREWRKLKDKEVPPGFTLETRSEVVAARDSGISSDTAREARKLAAREYRSRKRAEQTMR